VGVAEAFFNFGWALNPKQFYHQKIGGGGETGHSPPNLNSSAVPTL